MSIYEDRLREAGIPFVSAGTTPGEIVWIPGISLTDEQSQIVADIELELFHPDKFAGVIAARERRNGARAKAKAVADLAGMTPEQVDAYCDTLGNVPDMREALKSVIKLVIALSNEIYPDLPGPGTGASVIKQKSQP